MVNLMEQNILKTLKDSFTNDIDMPGWLKRSSDLPSSATEEELEY